MFIRHKLGYPKYPPKNSSEKHNSKEPDPYTADVPPGNNLMEKL